MKSLVPISLLLLTLLLSACSNEEVIKHDYLFTGEGQYWEAEYIYEGTEIWGEENNRTTYSHEKKDTFVLTFKGSLDEMQSIKNLDYSYQTSAGGSSVSREFDQPPNDISFRTSGGGTGAKINKDETIPVIVKWNGSEESFELINKAE
ncbi:hypothetical protein [Halalkalibacter alkaliphilus]|uniref:Lipoprotein n=1 Tax=Halalkalibacter alkaliphilus TaxID=2917993 RepID=A0A9X2A0J9_9BACI|nr:hypothetical protein [Halalkalibacter alkaliphilus]MCL7745625.1 hypothetical protein [Halalkalibacter alkaliphilus]